MCKLDIPIYVIFQGTLAVHTMVDYRKEWIKNRVLTFLDEEDASLFDQMCARHGNKIGKRLTDYLEDRIVATHDLDKRLFIVYKTYYDKVVHEEVIVAEQGNSNSCILC